MEATKLPNIDNAAEARELALEAELRAAEERGRRLLEQRERDKALRREPEYAI